MFGLDRKLRRQLILLLLVPYAFLAAAAPFLHTCLGEPSEHDKFCVSSCHTPGRSVLAPAFTAESKHHDCAACVWTRDSGSAPLFVGLQDNPSTISGFAPSAVTLYERDAVRLTAARGPPQG